MAAKTEQPSALQRRLYNQRWGPLAYSYLVCIIMARMAKYTWLYITGKTPPKQPYTIGMSVAMLFPPIEQLNIQQYRTFMSTAVSFVQFRHGLGTETRRAKWASKIKTNRWQGYWIPFQDQVECKTKDKDKVRKAFDPSEIPLGSGCDMVVIAIHGGGFIDGSVLMFLDMFRKWMKHAQKSHGLRVGILSVEYGLSPEHPYPTAMNEIIAAYEDLIMQHGVDSKRIILLGDSAGGNICLGTSLKLRDAFSTLGAPAGEILICPWVRSPETLKSSMFDVVSAIGCEVYLEAYAGNDPTIMASQYTAPFQAVTLTGLSPMLIFIGGVEILRPSIEQFVDKARMDGVDVAVVVAEDRSHNYFLLDEISTRQDREAAYEAMSVFVSHAHSRFTQQ
ncbi:hypothetical protein EDD11_002053 [Mortierella claussenii]|nr:hypothetical protein EDD11_002053 [Mortierella claussenii]